jgi:LuxR family transcriptional regulator, maltose regulon positive regulatory protein
LSGRPNCERTSLVLRILSRPRQMPTCQAASLSPRRTASNRRVAEGYALPATEKGPIPFRKGFVRRPALVRRLVEAGPALALIVAPAGYGKSTLLAEWAERDEREFIWLTLGDEAAEAAVLGATSTMISLGERTRRFVLVLDDAHEVAPTVLRGLMNTVFAYLPEGSTVALASRAEPALPVGRLRAHRALVEVRARDLGLAPAEAAVLLRRSGLELEFEAVQTLVRRTEGWPAALYLAALSLREQPDLDAAVARFAGDDHLIAEFVDDEVLSLLPSDLGSFSVRTSALDVLCGPLCDAVLEADSSAVFLAKLARLTQFLVPLDAAHQRYRWHTLVRDALQAALRREEPRLEARIQRRASAWYRRQGDIDSAIEHAFAAGDAGRAGDLLWSNIHRYVTAGRHGVVQRWLGTLTSEQIEGRPALALAAAHSSLIAGRAEEAQRWALVADGVYQRQGSKHGPQALTTGIAAIGAMAARGGAACMAQTATHAYDLEPPDSPWRAFLCLARGIALHLTGDSTAATQLLDEGAELSSATQPTVKSLCLAQAIMISIEQQDWALAAELADRATAVLEEELLFECPVMALVFAATAAVRAHEGSVDRAKKDLRHGIELLATLGDFIPWYGAETRILLAHASLWLADIVGARTLLAEASRLARRMPGATIFQRWFDEAWAYMDTMAETRMAGPSSLTIAELRILRFLPSHRSFREIAQQLGVSANTVKTQAHAVYRKLGAASRSEAVARGQDAGLLGQ